MNTSFKYVIAVGLGSGLSPKASGTTGTIGVLPIIWLCWEKSLAIWLVGLIILLGLGFWSIDEASRRLGEPDHSQIVIDEWIGMWISAMGAAFLTDWSVGYGIAISFIGFRFFDITKIWPVSWGEKLTPNVVGVLMDDIIAGLYVVIFCGIFSFSENIIDG